MTNEVPLVPRPSIRGFLRTAAASLLLATGASLPARAAGDPVIAAAAAAAWDATLHAHIGLSIYDTGSHRFWAYRADERFPMASTSKALVCAKLLAVGPAALDRKIPIGAADVLSYAPVTKAMVGQAPTARELCGITLRTSDNTAVNKVLEAIGGPQSVTAHVRTLGDAVTRLDRREPDLNQGTPGDPRDTTTPRAMMQTLYVLTLGTALNVSARHQLTRWLRDNQVGAPLLRAGLPPDWQVADRTGAGGFGTRGVIAVLWPPRRAPLVAAIYVTDTAATMEQRNSAIASIGRAIAHEPVN